MIILREIATDNLEIVEQTQEAFAAEDREGWEFVRALADGEAPHLLIYADGAAVENLAQPRASKLAAISAEFDRQVALGCNSPLGRVDCDDQANSRITALLQGIATATEIGWPNAESWPITMLDQAVVLHDLMALKILKLTIGVAWAGKFARKQALEALVQDAASAADLAAIDLNEGWEL